MYHKCTCSMEVGIEDGSYQSLGIGDYFVFMYLWEVQHNLDPPFLQDNYSRSSQSK